jgi:hypothetical protein
MLLFPGLSAKQTPTALPSHLLMLDTEGKKRLGLELRKTRTTTKLPEEVFSHYKPLKPAEHTPIPQWKPGPAKGGSRGDSLKNDARRSRRRHRVRGQAVDAAWMLKQEVLDQAR